MNCFWAARSRISEFVQCLGLYVGTDAELLCSACIVVQKCIFRHAPVSFCRLQLFAGGHWVCSKFTVFTHALLDAIHTVLFLTWRSTGTALHRSGHRLLCILFVVLAPFRFYGKKRISLSHCMRTCFISASVGSVGWKCHSAVVSPNIASFRSMVSLVCRCLFSCRWWCFYLTRLFCFLIQILCSGMVVSSSVHSCFCR